MRHFLEGCLAVGEEQVYAFAAQAGPAERPAQSVPTRYTSTLRSSVRSSSRAA